MDRRFVFGLGTGRCGTVSLYQLLNSQRDSKVTHEGAPYLPWVLDEQLIELKLDILKKRNYKIVGEVALFYLQSVETILKLLPQAKFVVLKRDKKGTLDSFDRKWDHKYNRIALKKKPWDSVFPYYDLSINKAVSKYYDVYYKKAKELQKKYYDNVKIFSILDLNNVSGVLGILDFCRIPPSYKNIKIGIRKNRG
jgi:hypothetical protein